MTSLPDGIEIRGEIASGFDQILTRDALALVAKLQRELGKHRIECLKRRQERQARLDAGESLDFLSETKHIRDGDWTCASIPAGLRDRRVEITGPTDRKMVINALNSGAKMFMADFEDANSPTWRNMIEGQINLCDAIRRAISFSSPEGKEYKLGEQLATLLVRPRGWHLVEKHMLVDGQPVAGGLFDFGLYFFHNARELLDRGSGPYFYLPKMESHLEARIWNDAFNLAQDELGIPRGSVRATVLSSKPFRPRSRWTKSFELRDHSAGLNCGRWDYIFSCIKKFRNRPDFVLADRALITMTTHFMHSYSLLCIKTCHRRNTFAMGGMAAFIPVKDDLAKNEQAFANVRADKEREANDGHDGTWVAHPGMVQLATEAFDAVMPQPNQIARKRDDVKVTARDLLDFQPNEPITEAGLRQNVSVGVQYLEAWLRGRGAVPLFNLMEDAATAEISRAQVWQWIRNSRGVLSDGRKVTKELFGSMLGEELAKVKAPANNRFNTARELFARITTDDQFAEFLTLPAYDALG
jgi:malate synthase